MENHLISSYRRYKIFAYDGTVPTNSELPGSEKVAWCEYNDK